MKEEQQLEREENTQAESDSADVKEDQEATKRHLIQESEEEMGEKEPTPKQVGGNWITRLYDKIPLTFKQADIIAKIAVAVAVLVLVLALITAPGPGA